MKIMSRMNFYLVFFISILSGCNSNEQTSSIAYIDSVKLFEGFTMKSEYDKMLEGDLSKETKTIDSINVLMNNSKDSISLYKLRKEYFMADKLFNSKFEQLSSKYTTIVNSRLNEYLKEFALANKIDMLISSTDGNVLYVHESKDLTDKMIEFANQKFEN